MTGPPGQPASGSSSRSGGRKRVSPPAQRSKPAERAAGKKASPAKRARPGGTSTPLREDRRHQSDRRGDQRVPGERDRDRILYTSAFRRLSGVTQVAHAGEGQVFHNRLTHTLEVAQIARRLAQYLQREQTELATQLGLDPEVAEAAALAHDLGHPPFGHHAEEALDHMMREKFTVQEGFEGNAQTFRIVTVLSVRSETIRGLNLTRATLNAILKYPWHRRTDKGDKFGAYMTEGPDLKFARARQPRGDEERGVEAEIMDWADDIAYAVHDLEDFYRAGLIPLDRILEGDTEREEFLGRAFNPKRWPRRPGGPTNEVLAQSFRVLLDGLFPPPELLRPYSGSIAQRAALRSFTGQLIQRYILGTEEAPAFRLADPTTTGGRCVEVNETAENELSVLKRLTWEYVIYNAGLATQQAGQKRIVCELFEILRDSAERDGLLLPPTMRELLYAMKTGGEEDDHLLCCRIALDCLCRMTEDEAVKLFHRVTGLVPGSILDGLLR